MSCVRELGRLTSGWLNLNPKVNFLRFSGYCVISLLNSWPNASSVREGGRKESTCSLNSQPKIRVERELGNIDFTGLSNQLPKERYRRLGGRLPGVIGRLKEYPKERWVIEFGK